MTNIINSLNKKGQLFDGYSFKKSCFIRLTNVKSQGKFPLLIIRKNELINPMSPSDINENVLTLSHKIIGL